jgi:hypothetical protein
MYAPWICSCLLQHYSDSSLFIKKILIMKEKTNSGNWKGTDMLMMGGGFE